MKNKSSKLFLFIAIFAINSTKFTAAALAERLVGREVGNLAKVNALGMLRFNPALTSRSNRVLLYSAKSPFMTQATLRMHKHSSSKAYEIANGVRIDTEIELYNKGQKSRKALMQKVIDDGDFEKLNFSGFFNKLDLSGGVFDGINLPEARFYGSNLSGTRFFKANLRGAIFAGANVKGSSFEGADLRGAYFDSAVDLEGVNFSGVNFEKTNLYGIDFRRVNLRFADFREAILCYVNFSGLDLRDVNLQGADLSASDLRYTNLRYRDFRDMNLRYADLRGADFSGANFMRAHLEGVKISREQAEQIRALCPFREFKIVGRVEQIADGSLNYYTQILD